MNRNWSRVPVLLLVALSMVLLGSCAAPTAAPPAPTAPPQIVEKTVVVPQTVVAPQTVVVQPTAAPTTAPAVTFKRDETLYTTGVQWGPPSSWNPWNGGGYSVGTVGLIYETLFIYDPLTDKFTPWLAESANWLNDTTWEVKIRQGVNWTDGKPLTADDVKFTMELADPNGKYKGTGLAFQNMWKSLASIDKKDANTLDFKFKSTPPYQEVGFYFMYQVPIVPQHLWEGRDVKDISGGPNDKPVGSGMYMAESAAQDRAVLVRNDNWWGIKAFGKTPGPKRIVDIVVPSNNVGLGLVLQGGIDLDNNFLPGVATLVKGGYGVTTYYPDAPYMIPANTVQLIFNLQKKPMDDLAFRKALAYSINVDDIVQNDYAGLVAKSDPTGLMPSWDKYVDKDQVKQLGWSYDPAKSKQILADAGYKDVDGDGFLEAPDGSKIDLKITCPSGWTDWMAAIQIMSKNFATIGIKVTPDYPDYGGWLDSLLKGTLDMSIRNEAQLSSTVYSYYMWVFQHPLDTIATAQWGNYGRYNNPDAFALVDQLDQVKVGDDAAIKAITSKLQKITMTDLPTIPLWYNGLWAQMSTTAWTNWPTSTDKGNHYLPATWRGYWNMTSGLMLLDLKPVPKQ
ncbi:MAG: ABC transporter substrate-binding protein [Chloroflexi bacterium]|nr:ABC transporter substrate-binding protein [Chloroflexota bacterium]